MKNESFRERNRRQREENAFENLYTYARTVQIPDPKATAEREARRIHGSGTTAEQPARSPGPDAEKVPHRLDDRTKEQLYARAQELDIEGRSQMTKDELIDAIRDQQ